MLCLECRETPQVVALIITRGLGLDIPLLGVVCGGACHAPQIAKGKLM
jgi:hypothetical protein